MAYRQKAPYCASTRVVRSLPDGHHVRSRPVHHPERDFRANFPAARLPSRGPCLATNLVALGQPVPEGIAQANRWTLGSIGALRAAMPVGGRRSGARRCLRVKPFAPSASPAHIFLAPAGHILESSFYRPATLDSSRIFIL